MGSSSKSVTELRAELRDAQQSLDAIRAIIKSGQQTQTLDEEYQRRLERVQGLTTKLSKMSNKNNLTLEQLQEEVRTWTRQNFGKPEDRMMHQPVLGAAEEVGELCHAHLKWEQGIRGTPEELEAKAKDAVGDVIIYLADYCNLRGFNLQDILEDTWMTVSKRNWKQSDDNQPKVKNPPKEKSLREIDPFDIPKEWDPTNCKVHDDCWCQACECEDE
jgi:NTP pyrophosphatase (non-canonical NTP hydrolase)